MEDVKSEEAEGQEDDEQLEALLEVEALADETIKGYTFARTEIFPEDEDDGLTEAGAHLIALASALLKLLAEASSQAWERDLQFHDLREEIARLRDQLRESVALGDLANPPRRQMNALESAYKKAADTQKNALAILHKQNEELRSELKATRAALEAARAEAEKAREELAKQRSSNWMLKYQCMDIGEEVWRLNVWLRNSTALCDLAHPPPKPKTALERALEEKIATLEARIRNPMGRPRSTTL